MADNIKYRLCGGTFLVLLFESKGRRRVARSTGGRPSDHKNNPEIFGRLVKITNPSFEMPTGRSFSTFTSDYKLCRSSDSPIAMITDDSVIRAFDERIKTSYFDVLSQFKPSLDGMIDWGSKGQWLIAALIELIEADTYIPDDALFYVRPYGHPVEKSKLREIECICIPSFILGVWHYILNHVKDNTVGASTIDLLLDTEAEIRAERKFKSNIGKETALAIKTSVDTPENEWQYYSDPTLEEFLQNNPMQYIAPGVLVGASNVQSGQIYINGKKVVSMDDMANDEAYHTPFATYLTKAVDYYSSVKTLLYAEKPRRFKDFYICNDLQMKGVGMKTEDIPNISMGVLYNISKKFIISGTGGIGKSMMMRHLFFEAAEHFNTYEVLPVLSALKNFKATDTNIAEFSYKTIKDFDPKMSFEAFEEELKAGRCMILLDGLDEIATDARKSFENAIVSFLRTYPQNFVILSSRPYTQFVQFGHFPVMQILPFDKKKAIRLIDKLEFHDPAAKEKFRDALEEKLFDSHKQFASNPLLLTIMLMTYSANGEIPQVRHVFYAKAYETMARLHDASKGAYVRPLHTKLTPEQFATYFAEFCARTYRAEALEFTEQSFTQYMKKVIAHQKRDIMAEPRDFLQDLTNNLCIMYEEGDKYYFIHRSFQEYFAAVFFSNQMDDMLGQIGDFFESQEMKYSDRTFDMLYDMIPEKIDRYIFLPFLNTLWKECDEGYGYRTFLQKMYPVIYAQSGETSDAAENDPVSNLYNFLINEYLLRQNGQLYDIKWPDSICYCSQEEWVEMLTPRKDADGKTYYWSDTVRSYNVPQDYIEMNGEPDISGFTWQIDVEDIYSNPQRHQDMIDFMENDSFPLKKEYNDMRVFSEELNKRINSKPQSDDWFDAF